MITTQPSALILLVSMVTQHGSISPSYYSYCSYGYADEDNASTTPYTLIDDDDHHDNISRTQDILPKHCFDAYGYSYFVHSDQLIDDTGFWLTDPY